jgi:hypothetical protein
VLWPGMDTERFGAFLSEELPRTRQQRRAITPSMASISPLPRAIQDLMSLLLAEPAGPRRWIQPTVSFTCFVLCSAERSATPRFTRLISSPISAQVKPS